MNQKKIFILASERSGTNLLRTLLDNHKDICGPVAPHFFDAFAPNITKYGDLSINDNKLVLLSHMLKLANHPYHDWELKSTPSDIADSFEITTIETALDALYSAKSKQQNKIHYACKDNSLFNYMPLIDKLDGIKLIFLYRDPRDHVASWMRTPLFMHTPFDVINKWIWEQNRILEISENYPVHFLSYEKLIGNVETEMTEVLNFLGLSVDKNCFSTDSNNKESKRNEFWKNLSKPIIKENSKKYRKSLSKRDIKIIESKAKNIMERLDYSLDTKANWQPYKGFRYELKLRRKISRYRNKDMFVRKMADLQDKLALIKSFEKDVEND